MMTSLPRRLVLKALGVSSGWLGISRGTAAAAEAVSDQSAASAKSAVVSWTNTHDRVWLGEKVWANPMEDWRVVDGAAQCQSGDGDRSVHLLTHQLTNSGGSFETSITVEQAQAGRVDSGVGFRVGVRSDLNEYRSNCFAKNGIAAGVVDGKLILANKKRPVEVDWDQAISLRLSGSPSGDDYLLKLSAYDASGKLLSQIETSVASDRVLGNLAFVNNYDRQIKKNQGAKHRFRDWTISGDALTEDPTHQFGPLLWSMYSLSDSRSDEGFILKLSALTGPLGESDNKDVELMVQQGGQWKSMGSAALDTDAWVATFRITNWDEKQSTPFKLVYQMTGKDGEQKESTWEGTVRANPVGRPLRMGALTCQNDYAFPYQPVAENLLKLDPDLLYFSGDQIYEGHGGYGIIRDPAEPAILNYLRKFYQHGWSFREAMRDRPTLCLPDDHDVFQGNIWGEGGAPMAAIQTGASSKGGYREPARMINAVHKTNVGHHPDPFDPTPAKQDISVYFGDMVYGGVSFAVIADRQFKSGPERVETGSGRADHVMDPEFDTAALNKPGLVLLGERQEAFLQAWVDDWRGHNMKVVLSQTVFAGVATHHGNYNGYLKADLDCGSWPQTARDRAISIIRQGKALHINGDQHLPTLVQYGVEKHRDSGWSFCTPAIAVGYPRWWRPDEVGMPHQNRPEHGLPQTGEYIDGLGNKAYVYAVGYPEVASKKNRYDRAHQKGSGFGLVTIDTEKETYQLEAFKFLVDATDGSESNQFEGWPLTISKSDNGPS